MKYRRNLHSTIDNVEGIVSAPIICDVCLRSTNGKTGCDRHPSAAMLNLDQVMDRDLYVFLLRQRRKRIARGIMLTVAGLSCLYMWISPVFLFLNLIFLPLSMTVYLIIESTIEHVVATRSAAEFSNDMEILSASEVLPDEGTQSAQLRGERRNRRIERNNQLYRQVKNSLVRASG